jgi:hypothetical protein
MAGSGMLHIRVSFSLVCHSPPETEHAAAEISEVHTPEHDMKQNSR